MSRACADGIHVSHRRRDDGYIVYGGRIPIGRIHPGREHWTASVWVRHGSNNARRLLVPIDGEFGGREEATAAVEAAWIADNSERSNL